MKVEFKGNPKSARSQPPIMTLIYYLPDEKWVEADEADTILECSLVAGIPHTHICGGSARCSTCRVFIIEGLEHCEPRNDAEQELAEQLGFVDGMRLACQTQVTGSGKVTLRRLTVEQEDVDLLDDQFQGKPTQMSAIGQEKQIAILFADLRGFTTFSEALPPYDVIYILNRYFRQMGRAIAQHGGMINNYMGDGLMALFGCDQLDHVAERSVRAALDMQQEMAKFNHYLSSVYQQELQIGIGIHYGQAVIGSVGASIDNHQVTAIGDAVNLASRIEAANKKLGTSLLISEETYAHLKNEVTLNHYSQIEIPGKKGAYTLYEVVAIANELPAPITQMKRRRIIFPHRSVLLQFWTGLKKWWRSPHIKSS
jgi:adenylate cyclase